jgi:FG-GAP repeat
MFFPPLLFSLLWHVSAYSVCMNEDMSIAVSGKPAEVSGFGGHFEVYQVLGDSCALHPDSPFKSAGDVGPFLGVGYSNAIDVAIWNTTIVYGAPNNLYAAGRVYVFDYNGSTWIETAALSPSSEEAWFGFSLGIYNDTLVVGAPADRYFSGRVWVYQRRGGEWLLMQQLVAQDGDPFAMQGISVSVWGDVIAVSAPYDDDYAGSVWVYEWHDGNWTQAGPKLTAGVRRRNDAFGHSISVRKDVLAVGAWGAGQTHVFERDEALGWVETQTLVGSITYPFQAQGASVYVAEDAILVSTALGPVAAFVFSRVNGTWTETRILEPPGFIGIDTGQNTPGRGVCGSADRVLIAKSVF